MIIGDSIGVGVAKERPECVSYVKGGINSYQWNKKFSNISLGSKTVIISLGSNDHEGVRTIWELQQLRSKVTADRVFWIVPAIKPDVQRMVQTVAEQHNDVMLPITRLQPDGVHPSWAGYKQLADRTKEK